MKNEILPSLLAADFGRLADEILRAQASGADALHLDIMDPTFVPNMSFGPSIVNFCRKACPNFYRNVHLMMNRPDLYIDAFAKAGSQTLQIHVEADCDLHVELARIRAAGMRNAIVLNPETPVERIIPYFGEVDEILVMTVHPGFGGQKFIPSALDKIRQLDRIRKERGLPFAIEIDGGASLANCKAIADAGTDIIVAGSAVFGAPDIPLRVREFSAAIR